MEYLSTTALAAQLETKSNELFDKLKTLGWIERKNDKWILTNLGKQMGGQTRQNPKYGECWAQRWRILHAATID